MTSTPKPNRSPLTEAEYQTLRQLEDDIAALKAARAPVAEIGRKVAELKRGGLWRRPYWDYSTPGTIIPVRLSITWQDYCPRWLHYSRRYADQSIRLSGAAVSPELPVDRTRRHQNGAQGVEQGTISLTPVISVKLDEHLRAIFECMVADAKVSTSDMLRAMIVKCAILDGYMGMETING